MPVSPVKIAPKYRSDPYALAAHLYGSCLDPFILPWKKKAMQLRPPQRGMAVLDVGSGTGAQLNLYRRYGCRLFGIDKSPGMIAAAHKKHRRSLNLCRGSAVGMPYRDHAFDLILLSMMLHEISADARSAALAESNRVLKTGGRILVIDYRVSADLDAGGRLLKLAIAMVEMAAGKPHYLNYRNFLNSGGLLPLLKHQRLTVERHDVAGRGNIGLWLVTKDH